MKEEQIREILRSYCLLQARIAKAVCLFIMTYIRFLSFFQALKSWSNIRDSFSTEQAPL
jgi:hypothetical protein